MFVRLDLEFDDSLQRHFSTLIAVLSGQPMLLEIERICAGLKTLILREGF